MSGYENTRRIVYDGGATFVPVCDICGRFVKANKLIHASDESGLKLEPNAFCSKCGPTQMLFEGFIGEDD